jgi:hypothetical protein
MFSLTALSLCGGAVYLLLRSLCSKAVSSGQAELPVSSMSFLVPAKVLPQFLVCDVTNLVERDADESAVEL